MLKIILHFFPAKRQHVASNRILNCLRVGGDMLVHWTLIWCCGLLHNFLLRKHFPENFWLWWRAEEMQINLLCYLNAQIPPNLLSSEPTLLRVNYSYASLKKSQAKWEANKSRQNFATPSASLKASSSATAMETDGAPKANADTTPDQTKKGKLDVKFNTILATISNMKTVFSTRFDGLMTASDCKEGNIWLHRTRDAGGDKDLHNRRQLNYAPNKSKISWRHK